MFTAPRYLNENELPGIARRGNQAILGVVGFDAPRPAGLNPDYAYINVAAPRLDGSVPYEVWTCSGKPVWHRVDGLRIAIAGTILFGMIDCEAAWPDDLDSFAFAAYTRIFKYLNEIGYPHLLRVFNYLPRIHAREHGAERYRQFNAGRARAFAACNRATHTAPAACALGIPGGAPVIYFLASTDAGRPIENIRQVSAYRYPPQYGKFSPTFSRAIVAGTPPHLIISGTASIVGHESVHPGDAAAQTDETLRNMQQLLSAAGAGSLAEMATATHVKVYIRNKTDWPVVAARLAHLQPFAGAMVLNTDICREELLVEIEAICPLP